MNMKKHADGTVSISAYSNKIHTLISKGLKILTEECVFENIWWNCTDVSVSDAATTIYSLMDEVRYSAMLVHFYTGSHPRRQ
jgi:ABC-type ATPase with predicted acetyltransferase domain